MTEMEESHENQILFSDSTTVADDDGGKTIDAVFLYLTESRYPSGSSDIFKRAIRRLKEGSDVCSSRWCSVRPKEEKERSRKCIGRQLRFLQH